MKKGVWFIQEATVLLLAGTSRRLVLAGIKKYEQQVEAGLFCYSKDKDKV